MKEALLIFVVIGILLGLTAFRYRRQLAAMLQIWRMFQSIRKDVRRPDEQIRSEPAAKGELINCVKCRSWVPESGAIRLGPGTVYCSAECVEKASAR